MPELMTYAIFWPQHSVLKVGRTWTMDRIRTLTSTGGTVIMLLRDRPEWEEAAALEGLAEDFPRAFATEQSSVTVLPRGRGFTECFRVSTSELEQAIASIFRGIARHGNEQAAADTAGFVSRRGSDEPGRRGGPDGDRAALPLGRFRSGVDDGVEAEGGAVAAPAGHHGGRDRGSSVDPGGPQLSRDLHGPGADVLPAAEAGRGVAPGFVVDPAASARSIPESFWRGSGSFLGWGGREGGEREGVGGEAGRNPSIAFLSDPPAERYSRELSSLWDRAACTRAVVRSAQRIGDFMNEVTPADLKRTRAILAAQQRWWDVVERAALARDFGTFHEQWEWLQSVPKVPPSLRGQQIWLEAERVKAGCYRGDPIVPEDRQLELAMAALGAVESQLPETAESVKALNEAGFDDHQISDRIGVSVRQVLRWRTRMDLPARSHGAAVMAETHTGLGMSA